MKHSLRLLCLICIGLALSTATQAQIATPEEVRFYTLEWEGERFPDGRPKLSPDLLERLKNISIEEAWGVLRGEGYHNQFAGDWEMLHQDRPFTGQALTAQYMPRRPQYADRLLEGSP